MEFTNFINIIKRQKYALLAIPLLVMILTFVLVRRQPNTYESHGRIAAGVVDGSQSFLNKDNTQESKITQTFSNLIQVLQLKTVYDEVSYQLILHDLTTDTPFKKQSKLLSELNTEAKRHAVTVFSQLYRRRQPLALSDNDQNGLNEVIKSMHYDYESLRGKTKVWRLENSDYIDIGYESENPMLSAFVVNTLSAEFISYYTYINQQNGVKAIDFLGALLKEKKDSLDNKMQELKIFKIKNRVLNLNEQAKSLYGQMADFETRRELTQKDVESNTGALRSIDSKFNSQDRQYLDSKLTQINQDILSTQEQLDAANDGYIKSGFNGEYQQRIDSLKAKLSEQINKSTDKFILNPLSAKDNLVMQKLKIGVDLDLAKNSIKSYDGEIAKLNQKFDMLVPNEAVIQAYEEDINVASQEYIEILKKYNQANMDLNSAAHLKQIETASPGELQPSKKMVLVILSGLVTFVLYIVVLFVLFYIDNSIKVPAELADKTNIPVLGYLPLIRSSYLDVKQLWDNTAEQPVSREFKNLLRSLRYEIDMCLYGGRLLAVTSIAPGEGKTLFAISIASAYLMVNKRVLIIDGNFNNPSVTDITSPVYFIEEYLTGRLQAAGIAGTRSISVLGNRGADTSLFELAGEAVVRERLLELKDHFDIIIIETPDLYKMNQTKEWLEVCDRVIAVFEAGKTLHNAEIQQVEFLRSLKQKFAGWVLNKVSNEKVQVKEKRSFFMKKAVA